ncbi:hypothetical protein F4820DRAFT_423601 [Hypoxylon rubiginosum]|uniref:Uncharacterized protein n=1 Tax=Hypoxylon rubiginosum TaxID=110542 RepID=A0ACB9YYI9_9PEZI|nr:hypothetical protein F4820DRAFT_423601 [Hypoxylon rubiginosum]
MRLSTTLTLATLCCRLPQTFAAACADTCKSCGWYCNQGCDASSLPSSPDLSGCNRCLYCRRESSSCGFVDIGDTWTVDPPSDELCAACDAGCWCHGDWYCADNATGPPPPSPPTRTSSVVLPLPTGL